MEYITYREKIYPSFQAKGFASQFCFPFAKEFCKGEGFDIGCCKEDWKFPGAQGIDLKFNDGFDAYNLPNKTVDYIFSSHCLEHLPDWIGALNHWTSRLKINGILFLYLPHYDQEYWRPWNNRKHIHVLSANLIKDYLQHNEYGNIFVGEKDLNFSFTVVAQKLG